MNPHSHEAKVNGGRETIDGPIISQRVAYKKLRCFPVRYVASCTTTAEEVLMTGIGDMLLEI